MLICSEPQIIIIVAPSGSGKSTLIQRLKQDCPSLLESVSCTTRQRREQEEQGIHYHFMSEEAFLKLREEGEFLEWAYVHGHYYGTRKYFVEEELEKGRTLLFDLDVQGTDSFKAFFGDKSIAIFIAPPSEEELCRRLKGRGTDSEEVIRLRLENAKKELKRRDDFDYCIVNDDLDHAYEQLLAIVQPLVR